jgi:DNA-binding NarL/FixJ family response regulator
MKKLTIIDTSYIAMQGLSSIVSNMEEVFDYSAINSVSLADCKDLAKNDILIIDYAEIDGFQKILVKLKSQNPNLKILAITERIKQAKVIRALKSGVDSHLLKSCGMEEIQEAIDATLSGKQFFCGQVLEIISNENEKGKSCEGVELTEREVDIIKLIAKGYTNKEVADKLNISSHTVNTHRKNMMAKLNINNVAGLVVYAFKEDLLLAN